MKKTEPDKTVEFDNEDGSTTVGELKKSVMRVCYGRLEADLDIYTMPNGEHCVSWRQNPEISFTSGDDLTILIQRVQFHIEKWINDTISQAIKDANL